LEQYKFNLTEEGFARWFLGKSIKGGITSFLIDNKLNIDIDTFIQQKIDATVDIFAKNINFYEDTINFIKTISKGNVELQGVGYIKEKPLLAMVTGLERVFLDILMKYHDFEKLFPITISATDYTKSKPDPECINITLFKMGIQSGEVIGIEDSPSGILVQVYWQHQTVGREHHL
jgi:beta-phosphoglucomutase-like phosphatase (HAD superfamily)